MRISGRFSIYVKSTFNMIYAKNMPIYSKVIFYDLNSLKHCAVINKQSKKHGLIFAVCRLRQHLDANSNNK